MSMIDLHYPIAGLFVLVGGIGFMKFFDFLASKRAKRLLEMTRSIEQDCPVGNPCR